ncbi:hypothetical protein OKW21_001294 [Catalinimonas alkaloidigena]|uniref:M56 family metallopeptidase n=1 Tax=Catalinimonas alkaloidigena TaxID=1075417 RepID=UPI002406AC1D|nr:M56 family metallopeptidase [Catalinimonas alkaloidigena]MDF9796031.1 hypothetical protein [Catalinimonas alkaloidigena]
MRAYLLTSIFLACVLPVLDTTVPSTLSAIDTPPDNAYGWNTYDWLNLKSYTKATSENTSAKAINWLLMLPLFLYIGGIVYKSWVLCKELHKISRLISCHPKVKESQYMIVYQAEHLSTFSFLNYIFLGKGVEGLHAWEVAKIKAHEQVHVRQKHSLDLLFFELFSIVFWFNPLVTYLKESLQNVHEFLADEEVSGKGKQQKAYAHLLIKLSGPADSITLATSFTKKQIHNRITMLMKTRTLALKKFYVLTAYTSDRFLTLSFFLHR